MKKHYFLGCTVAAGSLLMFPDLSLAHGGGGAGHGFSGGGMSAHGFGAPAAGFSGRGLVRDSAGIRAFAKRNFYGRGDHGRFGDRGFRGRDRGFGNRGFSDFDGDFLDAGFYGFGYPYYYDYPYYYRCP